MRAPFLSSLLLGSALVASLSTITACIRRDAGDTVDRRPRLRWVAAHEPESADPALCQTRECRQHASLTLDGLFRADAQGNAVPSLAETWAWRDSRTLVVTMKRGVRWSDGEPLDGMVFVRRWRELVRRCRDLPEAAAPLLDLVDARAICAGSARPERLGVEARADGTVTLRLERPNPLLPLALARPATWPTRDTLTASRAVALGPFRLERRGPLGWRYARNAAYAGAAAYIDGIDLTVLPEGELRLQSFVEAGADIVDDVPPLASLPAPSTRVQRSGVLHALVFHLPRRGTPPSVAAVRPWLAATIDRPELVRLARWPYVPVTRFFPAVPGSPDEVPATSAPTLAGSNAEWQELREELLRSGARLTLAVDGAIAGEAALALQAQWLRRLDLKIDLVSPTASGATMLLVALPGNRTEPGRRLGRLLALVGNELPGPRRRALEELQTAVLSAPTLRQLHGAVDAAEEALAKEGIVSPLFVEARPVLVRPGWRELSVDALGLWDARSARFE